MELVQCETQVEWRLARRGRSDGGPSQLCVLVWLLHVQQAGNP